MDDAWFTSNVPSYYHLDIDAKGGPDHGQQIPRQHSLPKGRPSSRQRVIEALLHRQGVLLRCCVVFLSSYICWISLPWTPSLCLRRLPSEYADHGFSTGIGFPYASLCIFRLHVCDRQCHTVHDCDADPWSPLCWRVIHEFQCDDRYRAERGKSIELIIWDLYPETDIVTAGPCHP
jgi:hypothetical protein